MVKKILKVEIADTPSRQQKGLMYRKSLPEEEGMLFKFKSPQNLRFWGFNTYIPLAIAFISPENEIAKISYISPCSTTVVASDYDCIMAIEANYDFFNKNGINRGNKIDIINEGEENYVKFLN